MCSTPCGIRGIARSLSQTCRYAHAVLNALRHQRNCTERCDHDSLRQRCAQRLAASEELHKSHRGSSGAVEASAQRLAASEELHLSYGAHGSIRA